MALNAKDTYRRNYRIRAVGEGGLNIVVTIPRPVIEREARRHDLSVEEFLDKFHAVAQYDNFDGVFYSFEKKNESNGTTTEANG